MTILNFIKGFELSMSIFYILSLQWNRTRLLGHIVRERKLQTKYIGTIVMITYIIQNISWKRDAFNIFKCTNIKLISFWSKIGPKVQLFISFDMLSNFLYTKHLYKKRRAEVVLFLFWQFFPLFIHENFRPYKTI